MTSIAWFWLALVLVEGAALSYIVPHYLGMCAQRRTDREYVKTVEKAFEDAHRGWRDALALADRLNGELKQLKGGPIAAKRADSWRVN